MTLKQAREQNLAVYMFANSPVGKAFQDRIYDAGIAQGREVHKFEEIVHGFSLLCVAEGPRPGAGQIAADMKRRKQEGPTSTLPCSLTIIVQRNCV